MGSAGFTRALAIPLAGSPPVPGDGPAQPCPPATPVLHGWFAFPVVVSSQCGAPASCLLKVRVTSSLNISYFFYCFRYLLP